MSRPPVYCSREMPAGWRPLPHTIIQQPMSEPTGTRPEVPPVRWMEPVADRELNIPLFLRNPRKQ